MMIRRLQSGPFAERARRSAREIVVAAVLTFAALVFVVAALRSNAPETASLPPPAQLERVPLATQPIDGPVPAPETATKDL